MTHSGQPVILLDTYVLLLNVIRQRLFPELKIKYKTKF
jgi:hypothetical protein